MDYYLFHYDKEEWEKLGNAELGPYEIQNQEKGAPRALANVQSSWDKIKLHLRPNFTHREHLPETGSIRHSSLALRQRPQGMGMLIPLTQIVRERELREDLEEETLGIVSKEMRPWWEHQARGRRAISRPPRHQCAETHQHVDCRDDNRGGGSSVTNGEATVKEEPSDDEWWNSYFNPGDYEWHNEPEDTGYGTC